MCPLTRRKEGAQHLADSLGSKVLDQSGDAGALLCVEKFAPCVLERMKEKGFDHPETSLVSSKTALEIFENAEGHLAIILHDEPAMSNSVATYLDSILEQIKQAKPTRVASTKTTRTDLSSLTMRLETFKDSGVFSEIFRDDLNSFVKDRFTALAKRTGSPELLNRSETVNRLKNIRAKVQNSLLILEPEERANLSVDELERMIDADTSPRVERLQKKVDGESARKPEDDPDLRGETNMRTLRDRRALKSGLASCGTTLYGSDPQACLNAPDVTNDPSDFEQVQAAVTDHGHSEVNRGELSREMEEADEAYHKEGVEIPEDSLGIRAVCEPVAAGRESEVEESIHDEAAPEVDEAGNDSREFDAREARDAEFAKARLRSGDLATPKDLSEVLTPSQLKIVEANRKLAIEKYGSACNPTFKEIADELALKPENVRQQIRRMSTNAELRKIFETVPNVEHVPRTKPSASRGATIAERLAAKQ